MRSESQPIVKYEIELDIGWELDVGGETRERVIISEERVFLVHLAESQQREQVSVELHQTSLLF